MQNRIIQWNCRGLKTNYEETLLLLQDYKPAALCLQETHLKETDNISIKNYTAFHTFSANNERAAGGVSIYINNNAPYSHVPFSTLEVMMEAEESPSCLPKGTLNRIPTS